MNKTNMEKITDVLQEHRKSLEMLKDICCKYEQDLEDLRSRTADMEAKLAYYVQDKDIIIQ